jgi:hypothetical protein
MRAPQTRNAAVVILFVLALGIFLRLFKLSAQSLWWDEGYMYFFVEDLRSNGLAECLGHLRPTAQYTKSEKGEPLYAILSSIIPRIDGPEVQTRAVSLLASILTIPVFWWFLRVYRLTESERLLGLLFVAISPFLIFYAQEGRPYALVLLWLLLFFVAAESRSLFFSTWGFVAMGALTLFIGLTHFMMLSAVGAVILYKLWTTRRERALFLRWFRAGVVCALASLPPLYLGWSHRLYTTPSEISIYPYLYGVYGFFVGFSLGPSTYELHLDTALAVLRQHSVVIASVGIVGGVLLVRGVVETIRRKEFFLVAVPLLALMFVLIFTVVTRLPIKNPRHFIFVFPFFVYWLVLGMLSLKPHIARNALMAAMLVLVVVSLYNYYFTDRYYKEGNREAANYVQNEAGGNDSVLVAVRPPFLAYYQGLATVFPLSRGDDEFFRLVQQGNHGQIWVVLSRPWEFDERGEKERYLRTRAELHEFQHVQVFHMLSAAR